MAAGRPPKPTPPEAVEHVAKVTGLDPDAARAAVAAHEEWRRAVRLRKLHDKRQVAMAS